MKKVLFVCTGNTCRSPMAEALFNFYTRDFDEFSASSCGIYGDGISPISENAKTALSECGIEFSHTSTPVSDDLLLHADYIIGMTSDHAKSIISVFPRFCDKVYAMPVDISDPYGGSLDTYRKCKDEIETAIKALINTLSGENNA